MLGKAGLADAERHGPFAPRASFGAQQAIEKAQMRETFFLRPRQQFIQRRGMDGNTQRCEVTQAPVTQWSPEYTVIFRGSEARRAVARRTSPRSLPRGRLPSPDFASPPV